MVVVVAAAYLLSKMLTDYVKNKVQVHKSVSEKKIYNPMEALSPDQYISVCFYSHLKTLSISK